MVLVRENIKENSKRDYKKIAKTIEELQRFPKDFPRKKVY
jgi:hypothetical protein